MTIVEGAFAERPLAHRMPAQEGVDFRVEACHALKNMWDISPGQVDRRGIFRASYKGDSLCDISHMATGGLDILAIRARIEQAMQAKSLSRRGLSAKAGLSQTAVRDLLDRTDNPGIGTLHKIAEALELPIDAISGATAVQLAGLIGAGGQVAYFKDDHEFEVVPRPPGVVGDLLALEVVGESMLPKYEAGDIIYVRRTHEGVLPTYIGRYCAIHLSDGGTYLKILERGSRGGVFTLRSLNAADMRDVEVVWAAPVLFVMPGIGRQLLGESA